MSRRSASSVVIAALSLPFLSAVALPARAEVPGRSHITIVAAEHLASVQRGRLSALGGDVDETSTDIQFLAGPILPVTPFNLPRLALDYVVVDHFTLGGGLAIAHLAPKGGTDLTYFTVNPRLGGLFSLSPAVAIWARAGFTYYHVPAGLDTGSGYGLDLELAFLFEIVDHAGVTASVFGDLGLHDERARQFSDVGASVGLTMWF